MVTLTKRGGVSSMRSAYSILRDRDLVKKIFAELPVRFEGRPGGYTRIIRVGSCLGDNAPMVYLELV